MQTGSTIFKALEYCQHAVYMHTIQHR